MNKKHRRMISLLSVTALCLSGCGAENTNQIMDPTVAVETSAVTKGNLEMTGTYIGTVENFESVSVQSMVTATVNDVSVVVGDYVEAGQILGKMDSDTAEIQLQQAQLAVDSAALSEKNAQLSKQSADISKQMTVAGVENTLTTQEELNQLSNQAELDAIYKQIDSSQISRNNADQTVDNYEDAEDEADDNLQDVKDSISKVKSEYDVAKGYSGSITVEYNNDSGNWEFVPADAEAGFSEDEQRKIEEIEGKGFSAYDISSDGLSDMSSQISSLENQANSYRSSRESAKTAAENAEASRDSYDSNLGYLKKQLENTQQAQQIKNTKELEDTIENLQQQIAVAEVQAASAGIGVQSAGVGIKNAETNLNSAQLQLSYYTLTAPISGVVEKVQVENNNQCAAGSVCFVISNPAAKTVKFYVSDNVVTELQLGQKVQVNINQQTYQGNISEIGVAAEDNSGLFLIKAVIENGDQLKSGISAEIVTVTHQVTGESIVPTKALYFEENQPYLYIVEENMAKRVNVELALYGSEEAAVKGVDAGSTVITTWSATLKDGTPVSIENGSEDGSAKESE